MNLLHLKSPLHSVSCLSFLPPNLDNRKHLHSTYPSQRFYDRHSLQWAKEGMLRYYVIYVMLWNAFHFGEICILCIYRIASSFLTIFWHENITGVIPCVELRNARNPFYFSHWNQFHDGSHRNVFSPSKYN